MVNAIKINKKGNEIPKLLKKKKNIKQDMHNSFVKPATPITHPESNAIEL